MEELVDDDVKVSVICLAYNHEKYIRNTLDGFVSQKTNFKFEVLVHDDASTDRTASIIREYEEKYPDIIKPMYQAENQYSKGIKISSTYLYPKAKGKYFAFCEGDDYWCDECKLQKQYDALEAHPECCICTCKVQCINEDGSLEGRTFPLSKYSIKTGSYTSSQMAKVMWRDKLCFQTSSVLIRRCVLCDYETVPYSQYMPGDAVIFRQALSQGSFYYIDEIMSKYRKGSIGSWSERMANQNEIEKKERKIRELQGDLVFDKCSNFQFHKWIIQSVANELYFLGRNDAAMMEETINELKLTKREVAKNCSLKNKIFYYIANISPTFWGFLLDIRRKLLE